MTQRSNARKLGRTRALATTADRSSEAAFRVLKFVRNAEMAFGAGARVVPGGDPEALRKSEKGQAFSLALIKAVYSCLFDGYLTLSSVRQLSSCNYW
jgi:hypothetical protein